MYSMKCEHIHPLFPPPTANVLHPVYLNSQIHIYYVSLQSPFSFAGMVMIVGPFSEHSDVNVLKRE